MLKNIWKSWNKGYIIGFIMKMVDFFIKLLPTKAVFAHCDIPCGIYDPHQAQLAAHTIIRMTNLITEAKNDVHQIARCTYVKEEHASIVEDEIVTLWADYFKKEHFKAYPNLLELINSAIELTGKVRQTVDLKSAQELLSKTQEIAEIFWKTKGMEVARIPSGYPTGGEIVSHK